MNTPVFIKLTSSEGLDPYLSAQLSMKAIQFKADITLSHQEREVNAKSLTEVMSLGAEHGSLLGIHAKGVDAGAALNALIALIQSH